MALSKAFAMPPPTEFAILLILVAAFLHAVWNALVKTSADRAATIGMVALGTALFGAMFIPFAPLPASESWPYMLASLAIHLFYFSFLILAYQLGDFSQVYPIARGVAPFLVASSAVVLADENLSPLGWLGLTTISVAISLLVFMRGKVPSDPRAIVAALLTGCCIAGYTMADGLGVRLSGSQFGYIGWKFAMQVVLGFGFLYWRRAHLASLGYSAWIAGIGGGLLSGLAYALAIYAMSLTTLGSVSAIRESSVIIAAVIGTVLFREKPVMPRILAALLVAIGVFLLTQG